MGRSSSSCNTLRPTRKHCRRGTRSRDRLALGHRHHGPTCECAVDRILKINFVDTNHGRCPKPYIQAGILNWAALAHTRLWAE